MKHLSRLSYATKILLLTFLIILVMALILSVSSWRLSSDLFSEMEKELLNRNVENVYIQLTTATRVANTFVTEVVQNRGIRTLAEMDTLAGAAAEAAEQSLLTAIRQALDSSATSTTSALQFINVYLKNGYRGGSLGVDALPYQSFSDWIMAAEAAGIVGMDDYVPTSWITDLNVRSIGVYGRSLVGIRFLYDQVSLEKVGIIVFGLRQSGLQTIFSSLNTDAYLVLRNGTVISAAHTTDLDTVIPQASALIEVYAGSGQNLVVLEDGTEAFVYRMSGGASWLICPVDENLLTHSRAATEYTRYVVVVTAIALVVALILSWLGSKGLTKSLVSLTSVVQKVYDGDLTARFQTDQHDEIAYLGLRINDMLEQVEDFFHTQERDATEKKNLELQLMQSQINPHLLYNTLNSALWTIRQGDMDKAEKLILSMSSFFKLTLSKGNEEITLANEISMIQYYLKLQNLGRGKAYTLQDQVPEECRSCRILRLTLQPLVENSVIHGFSDWRDDGEIRISASVNRDAGTLQIVLEDNGIGILPEDLNALREDLETYPPVRDHKHFGLYNIERRIRNKYGAQYGVTVESEVGDFTRITLTLPICREIPHD